MKQVVLALALSILTSTTAGALEIPLEKPKQPRPKAVKKQPIILDTRSAFEYTLGHLEGAAPIRWEDYSQIENPHRGMLDPDSNLLARKLRILGVDPKQKVLVVGNGKKGWGEAGRIAWMLKYLGVKDVEIIDPASSKGKTESGTHDGAIAAPIWLAKPVEKIRARKNDVAQIVKQKTKGVTIIDVRTAEEYNGAVKYGTARGGHIPGAVNIPWKEFAQENGVIKKPSDVKKVLKSHGVKSKNKLIFYCTGGVRAGYAAFAALEAGLKAQNYDGSFWQWSADQNLPIE